MSEQSHKNLTMSNWNLAPPPGQIRAHVEVFSREHLITQKSPAERLVDASLVDAVAKELGPSQPVNKDGTEVSCR